MALTIVVTAVLLNLLLKVELLLLLNLLLLASKGKQLTLPQSFLRTNKWSNSDPGQKAMVDAVAHFLVRDWEPINVVAGKGFQSLMALAEPRFTMRSCSRMFACC